MPATVRAAIEPTVDKRAGQQAAKDLERQLEPAEQLEPDVSSGALGKIRDKVSGALSGMGPGAGGAIGAGIGSQIGGTAGAAAGSVGGQALGGVAAGGGAAGMAASGALAGIAALSTAVSALADASPTFGAILGMLQTMFQMALMPIGRVAGQALMPFALKGIEMAKNFNNLVGDKGLTVALGETLRSGITKLPKILGAVNGLALDIGGEFAYWLSDIFSAAGLFMLSDLMITLGFMLKTAGILLGSLAERIGNFVYKGTIAVVNVLKRLVNSTIIALNDIVSTIPGVDSDIGTLDVKSVQEVRESQLFDTKDLTGLLQELGQAQLRAQEKIEVNIKRRAGSRERENRKKST